MHIGLSCDREIFGKPWFSECHHRLTCTTQSSPGFPWRTPIPWSRPFAAQRKIRKGSTWWPFLWRKGHCFYRHEAFAYISNCPVYFSMACPSAGPKCFCSWRWCSSAGYRASCIAGTEKHWGVTGCGANRTSGHEQLALLSPSVISYSLCFVWLFSVWQPLVEAIDWLWLLPMDGLQKGNGKINLFYPLGLVEVVNTCRTAEWDVTCQQMGSWAPPIMPLLTLF